MCIRDRSNATLPDEATDAAIDDEVTNLFFESLLESAKAVSYTHLDVYKRQI